MAASEGLGIIGVDNFHYFVSDEARSEAFYTERFGWHRVARSSDAMTKATGQKSSVYQSGDIKAVVSVPQSETCRAARYLSRHPAGIGSMTFEVEDIEKAWRFLMDHRDHKLGRREPATPIHGIRETRTKDGRFRHFSITTAIGDVSFRFVQREDYEGFAPGFDTLLTDVPASPLGFRKIDHVTNNAMCMAPIKLWMQYVLGMEQCWDIEFHTNDVTHDATTGTGLRSVVMWDPRSELKFPVNEPLYPFFKDGQINLFVEQNRGPGIQHIALEVENIVDAVGTLRERDVEFLNTPNIYYDLSRERLSTQGVDTNNIDHDLEVLRPLGILIDGSPEDNYLVQIFLKDAQSAYDEPGAGPFFYELIQRCGDQGFGGGNFRALFEAIERDQREGA